MKRLLGRSLHVALKPLAQSGCEQLNGKPPPPLRLH